MDNTNSTTATAVTNMHEAQVRLFLSNMGFYPGLSVLTFTQTPPISAANQRPVFCPECREQVGHRQQNLKRHILSMHLPCWIYCPHPSCTWRGTRKEELNKHVDKEQCGPKPERDQYQIYDTRLILGWILEDDVPLNVAVGYALDFVGERARELGKVEAWRDLWGRQ